MPAPQWKLVQAFLREVTEDEDCNVIANIEDAYATLRGIQRGHFKSTVDAGTTLIQTTVGTKQFSWRVADSLSAADVIVIAETVLQLLDASGTVAKARTYLRRRKSTRADFSTYQP